MNFAELKLKKWGNSLGLRIPSPIAKSLSLEANDRVMLFEFEGEIKFFPIDKPLRVREVAADMGEIVRYAAPRPYLAIRLRGPFPEVLKGIPGALEAVAAELHAQEALPSGPALVRYRQIAMEGEMTLEVGFPTEESLVAESPLYAGSLPSGDYAETVIEGPYGKLQEGTAAFLAWGEQAGLAWDLERGTPGVSWIARTEHYEVGPETSSEPALWRTRLSFKLWDA